MLSFASDYIAGAHPKVLQALVDSNLDVLTGYGTDTVSQRAAEKIKAACGTEQAQVYFLSGGTQSNQVVIDAVLNPYEGVIAAKTGHINAHEAGAIEYTGHKVLAIPGEKGKLNAEDVDRFICAFYAEESFEHMVFPGMVYISFPTEYGTLYTKRELTNLYAVCRKHGIPLYIDGARLGYGLMSDECDLTLPELAALCDAFYIGGTKVGALCGEAVVFPKGNAPKYFMTRVKQHGAMLAKGRLLGVQFDALFTDNLYFAIGKHGIAMAQKLKALFEAKSYPFFMHSPTNQQFIVLENEKLKALQREVAVTVWEPFDETHTVVRFAASWSTTDEDLAALAALL